ncbi:MAG: hypothetical protein HQL70_04000 [Magnetococcales bacterium]|nr:hypothetical protein [Magnetococcales bacterium]
MLFWSKWLAAKKQKKQLREQVMGVHDRMVDHLLDLSANGGLKVKDDYDLRFDLMVFFSAYLLYCLREDKEFSHAFWEIVFEGIQESLRIRGVTDIRIGARMQQAMQDATGRRNVYLAAWESDDKAGLRKAIARNILVGADVDDGRIDTILAALEGFPGIMMNSR